MYIVTAGQMQEMDRQTIEQFGIPGRVLMESAGRGATEFLLDTFGDLKNRKVGVIAGRGNNGGDGFVIARYLAQKGIKVIVYLLSVKEKALGDAGANLSLLDKVGVMVVEMPDMETFRANKTSMIHQDIWIDAILGTGLNSDVKGYFREIIEFINQLQKPVFSVDIPSGLNSDTGQPCGVCIRAHATATFAFPKTGHFVFPGAEFTGNLKVIDIGIPPHIAKNADPFQNLLTPDAARSGLRPRQPDDHKGKTGHLLILAGSPGKTGAAAMTAMSALRAGAGLVTLGLPKQINNVLETMVTEPMTFPLPDTKSGMLDESAFDLIMEQLAGKTCLALGPGIGTAPETRNLILRIIRECTLPLVIDADGLNNIADNPDVLKKSKARLVLTPHPGEMARLSDTSVKTIQKDRIRTARNFAREFQVNLALKGAGTVIAHDDGSVFINTTGNSGMASGGMGDVLTGVIAGLITQGVQPESAARTGVYLHGAAADTLAKNMSSAGYLASEVMNLIPREIQKLAGHP